MPRLASAGHQAGRGAGRIDKSRCGTRPVDQDPAGSGQRGFGDRAEGGTQDRGDGDRQGGVDGPTGGSAGGWVAPPLLPALVRLGGPLGGATVCSAYSFHGPMAPYTAAVARRALSRIERRAIWQAGGCVCAYCGDPPRYRDVEIDHIVPNPWTLNHSLNCVRNRDCQKTSTSTATAIWRQPALCAIGRSQLTAFAPVEWK